MQARIMLRLVRSLKMCLQNNTATPHSPQIACGHRVRPHVACSSASANRLNHSWREACEHNASGVGSLTADRHQNVVARTFAFEAKRKS